jgi:ATP-dependent Clp protease ATP-binding subunit ClpA
MLLGTTAGYVGYDDPLLFEPLLKNKRCVLLFDEMEKGHPAVLKVLMNAMGNGRLEATKPIDGQREFDFRQSIMLFTSNLPLSVENPEDMTQAEITRECRAQLTKPSEGGPAMPPEIAARFSEILLFRNLSDADKVEILGLTVMRTAEQYDLTVRKIAPAFMQDVVVRVSVDRGAREAVCEIEAILGNPLSAFAHDHEGIKDVALSGTCEQVVVEPYAG